MIPAKSLNDTLHPKTEVRRPIETLPKITPNVADATIEPTYKPILLMGATVAMQGNMDAGTNAAQNPIIARLMVKILNSVVDDAQITNKPNKNKPIEAIEGKLYLSTAGPIKKNEIAQHSETTLNEKRA